MDFEILLSNLTNPTLLFFVLGIIAAVVKSDLEIPAVVPVKDLYFGTKIEIQAIAAVKE